MVHLMNKIGQVIGSTFKISPEEEPYVEVLDSYKVRFSKPVDIIRDRNSNSISTYFLHIAHLTLKSF